MGRLRDGRGEGGGGDAAGGVDEGRGPLEALDGQVDAERGLPEDLRDGREELGHDRVPSGHSQAPSEAPRSLTAPTDCARYTCAGRPSRAGSDTVGSERPNEGARRHDTTGADTTAPPS